MGFWAAALDYCRNKKVFATSVQPRRLHQGKKNRRYTEAREMRSAGPLCTSLVPYLFSEPNCRIVSKISNLLLKVFHRPSIIRPNSWDCNASDRYNPGFAPGILDRIPRKQRKI